MRYERGPGRFGQPFCNVSRAIFEVEIIVGQRNIASGGRLSPRANGYCVHCKKKNTVSEVRWPGFYKHIRKSGPMYLNVFSARCSGSDTDPPPTYLLTSPK